MNPDIIEWYKANGYQFSDFFDSKRHGGKVLSRAQIKAGGEAYYNRVMSGEITPKRISIGWGIIKEAQTARYDDFLKDNGIIESSRRIIEGLNGDVNRFKGSLFRYKVLFWAVFGVAFCLFFKMIDIVGGIPL